jgi:hypothetical protein
MGNAIFLSEKLVALALLLQAVELIVRRKEFSETGIFRWSIVKEEFPKLVRAPLSLLFSERSFMIVLRLQILCVLGALITSRPDFIVALWPLTFLIALRFRGGFNGGADAMTMTVLTGLSIAALFPDHAAVGLGYIAFQTCFSYWRSGFEKARRKEWRSGESLKRLARSRYYGAPKSASVFQHSGFAILATWFMLGFELTFPLAILIPATATIYLTVGALFHLANIYLFGLNRFFWAWLAAYPAVWFIGRLFIG